MARRDSIQRINYIVDFLRKKPASFGEIISYLEDKSIDDGYDYVISQKTFKRDLELIESLLGIEIEYSQHLKKYKLIQDDNQEINLRIVEAYDTFNALKLATDISQYIIFEKRKAIGTEHLSPVLYAIKNKKLIRCSYQKFWDDEPNKRLLLPLALKENKQRWYLVAIDNKDQKLKTFGLDRITNLSPTDQGFIYPKDVQIDYVFKNCFGIINDEEFEAEEIILTFSKHQAKYIKSLPLHHSQEIIYEDERECRFKLFLKPTHDFYMEILSYGKDVEVLEPSSFRRELKIVLEMALRRY